MDSKIHNELKEIFSCSNSADELFDAFNYTIKNRLFSLELYQHLLWNKAISKDEILLYAFKICSVYPAFAFDINLLVADIFSSYSKCSDDYSTALFYYKKAISLKPEIHSVYVSVARLHNKDLNIPPLDVIVNIITEGLDNVECKSALYFALADLYEKWGNTDLKKKFKLLGDSASVNEI